MTLSFSLPNYTSIFVKGVDSEKLLQGQVSCDLSLDETNFNGLFCDEKGYVISNAVIIKKDYFVIIVEESVADYLVKELKKFAKFFKCEIYEEQQRIYGLRKNHVFTKHLGIVETKLSTAEWNIQTMKNFCFDITSTYSKKYRISELGYSFEKYVSYEKGCYRGQEIIARLTYLGKKVKKSVVFDGHYENIENCEGKTIGKKVFEVKGKELALSQFFIEDTDYYYKGQRLIPVSSQWEPDLAQ